MLISQVYFHSYWDFFKADGEKLGGLRKICARLTEIFFEADGEKFGGLRKFMRNL